MCCKIKCNVFLYTTTIHHYHCNRDYSHIRNGFVLLYPPISSPSFQEMDAFIISIDWLELSKIIISQIMSDVLVNTCNSTPWRPRQEDSNGNALAKNESSSKTLPTKGMEEGGRKKGRRKRERKEGKKKRVKKKWREERICIHCIYLTIFTHPTTFFLSHPWWPFTFTHGICRS